MTKNFILPERHRRTREREEAERRFVGSFLDVAFPPAPVAREEKFAQQTRSLLRPLTHPGLGVSDLHGGQLPLDQEVDVGEVGGVVVVPQLAGQGLQVGRPVSRGEGDKAGHRGEPDKHVLLAGDLFRRISTLRATFTSAEKFHTALSDYSPWTSEW